MAKTGERILTDGQRAYEERRAAKAGMTLDRWLEQKQRAATDDAATRARVARAIPARKPGLISRLIDRAHEPLK